MKFIIDCYTKNKAEGIRRLKALKTTVEVEDGGEYTNARECSQILLETSLTEQELDSWLYNTKFRDFEYIGMVVND
jgi:hypothetical protein